jgi:hypothetical protein
VADKSNSLDRASERELTAGTKSSADQHRQGHLTQAKIPNAETRAAMEEARAKMAAWQRERDEA